MPAPAGSEIIRDRLEKISLPRPTVEIKPQTKLDFFKKFISRKYLKLYVSLILLILVIIPIFTYIFFASDLRDKNSIMNRNNAGVQLLDDQGELFFSFYEAKNIDPVPLSAISKDLQNAVIVSEDQDFYNNPGFSIKGIARAFLNNLSSASIQQGGSTITQQLVKNVLLSSDRTFLRKYQELILSLEINRRYSKDDILEMYLNSVYFGEGAFGIENAAQKYFGKSANELNLSESSLLVAILPAPSTLSPLSGDLDAAKERQGIVLSQMEEAGYITPAQKEAARKANLTFAKQEDDETNTLAPHFAILVKDYLIEKYGEEKITRSGFKVKTTLSRKWQEHAETTVKNQVLRLAKNRATNGAAVVIDPKTGQVKSLVGSFDWGNDEFGKLNMATAPRQAGSSFKPIIYSEAFEQKLITPATIIEDQPVTFGNYSPKNYDKKFRGPVTVRRALANSLNIPAVKVMDMVGVADGIENAKSLGISTLDEDHDYGLPLVLGAAEVKLIELTGAYATFANLGKYNEPNFILEIRDKNDKIVNFSKPKEKKVISDGASFLITSILSDNNARQEVFGNALTVSRTAAVKTGTTEDYKDALTLGYTPNVAIGVWVGNSNNKPMDNIAGSLGAAPIWTSLMNTYFADLTNEGFVQPSSVVSKQICNPQTPSPAPNTDPSPSPIVSTILEFFLKGTEEKECKLPSPAPSPSPSASPSPTPEVTPTPSPTPSSEPTPSPVQSPSPVDSPSISPVIIPSPL